MLNRFLKVNVDWVKNIHSKADQQSFVDTLSSSPIVHRLVEILESRLEDRDTFKEGDYSNPSWAYQAADRNGYTRAIKEVIKLLTIKEKD